MRTLFTALLLSLVALPAAAKPGRYVRILSEPVGAQVFLDGAEKPLAITPARRIRVEYGYHELVFKLSGYEPFTLKLNVERETRELKAKLAQHATLELLTDDPEGMILLIDGEPSGGLPYKGAIKGGRHQVVVRRAGFKPFAQWFDVKPGQLLTIPVVMERAEAPTGVLFVSADVPAQVIIDGQPRGQTPLLLKIQPGPVLVVLSAKGHPPWKKTVEVEAQKKAIVQARLRPDTGPTGTVMVLSNVSGTTVFIDGTKTGTAPVTLKGLVKGTHIVEGKAEGYRPSQTTVRVEPDAQTVIKLELKPEEAEFGRISVRASVPGAIVFVDGGAQGAAPAELPQVRLGPHAIVVQAKGHRDFESACEVKRNQTCHVMAQLVPLASVKVSSNAAGARLFVNDEEIGPLPSEGAFPTGQHRFRVTAPNRVASVQRVTLQASQELRELNFELKNSQPSGEELQAQAVKAEAAMREAYRGASAYTGVPLGPGQNAIDVSLGFPYLAEVRGTVGLFEQLALSVGLRVLERDVSFGTAELTVRGHFGLRLIKALSLGAQLEGWAGTNFRSTGTYGGSLAGLATLHFAQQGSFTLRVAADVLHDDWSDAPTIDPADPEGGQTSGRMRGGATVVYWLNPDLALFVELEYKLIGAPRLLFNEAYFGAVNKDPRLYGRLGMSFAF